MQLVPGDGGELLDLPDDTDRVLGVFAPASTFYDRSEETLEDLELPHYVPAAPTLAEMTDKALRILESKERRFFMVIEEEGSDNFANQNNAEGTLHAIRRADEAFGVALERRAEALRLLEQQYPPEDLNDARRKMADIPAGAVLIDNPVSRAPGFQLDNVFVLPGVPRIMQAMVAGLRDRLMGGAPLLSRTVSVYLTEGSVAGDLAAVQAAHPATEIGSYPFVRDGRLGTSLVVRTSDAEALEAAVAAVRALVLGMGADPIEDAAA